MFFLLFLHPVRFRQSDAVLRRETGNDRVEFRDNCWRLRFHFADADRRDSATERMHFNFAALRDSLADSIPGFSRCLLFSHRYSRGFPSSFASISTIF